MWAVQSAIKDGLSRLKRMDIPAGTLATTKEDAARYLDWGFDFVAIGVDIGLLMTAAKARLEQLGNGKSSND